MKITKMLSQNRRDFTAEMTCESCGATEINKNGYDDNYYHTEVIPKMKCAKCGESSISLNSKVEPQTTKYPDGLQL